MCGANLMVYGGSGGAEAAIIARTRRCATCVRALAALGRSHTARARIADTGLLEKDDGLSWANQLVSSTSVSNPLETPEDCTEITWLFVHSRSFVATFHADRGMVADMILVFQLRAAEHIIR